MEKFVHLHVHSHYSLLDGGARAEKLVDAAKAHGMDAMAITDHGNLFGAIEFYCAARDAGVKPILGIEAYISPTTRFDRTMGNQATAAYHMILLAMNEQGWRNLIKLSSRAYLEGFYYRPRVDRELLSELGEGLICTSACLGGEIPTALLSGQDDLAKKIAGEYLDIFGPERFFIEVQNQGIDDQTRVNPMLIALAEHLGVGVVGTNDVHFLTRADKPAHEVLTCIATSKALTDEAKLRYPAEIYLKDAAEMRHALREMPAAADNTLKIAEMCNVELDFSAKHLPVFHTPDGQGADEYLSELAREGLRTRFDGGAPQEYKDRLDWELKVIADKGYSSYFLIVNDCVQFARSNDIPASPRGSAVGTLLGWCLRIAEIDPVKYGLLFERFTDPQREEDPDYDIDICQEGRAKVIQYVREKYGHVAQIITYGTLKARAAIRDVGRVLEMPLREVDALAKKVPEGPKVTLAKSLDSEPELKELYESDPKARRIIDYSMSLEGLARHAGIHAAGVIVASEPLENLVPLCKQGDGDDVITQWDGPTCEFKVGLMKMDLLGLRTLTIIQRARELVRDRTGEDIDPEQLPLDDQEVLDIFRQGHTDGIFQFESGGMKAVLIQMQPTRIEELIAANAMYRPGPMELIPTYIARKNGAEQIPSIHPLVDELLAETHGVMAFQEQVMQVLNHLGKIPLNRAYTLIKAISKKKQKTIAAERPSFIDGAGENGIPQAEAEALFDLILKFAGYGFNKAHSTRYAIVAYQMAYFKAHHPREFLAATLTFECGDTDKVVQYMSEAARMGVTIAAPDINACGRDFTVDGEQVRFGLAAVKGVGAKADLFHFCENVDPRAVNRGTIEALVKCGAFDSLGAHRAAMAAAMDQALQLGQQAASARKSGQMSFFDIIDPTGADAPAPAFPNVEAWSEAQLLDAEKETLGFYITSHPLVKYGRELDSLSSPPGKASFGRFGELPEGTPVVVGCMIASVRYTVTKTGRSAGKRMAILAVEDLTGKCEAVVFSDAYERLAGLLVEQNIVFLTGRIDRRRERPNIIVDEVTPIDRALEQLTGMILVRLDRAAATPEKLQQLRDVLAGHRGKTVVYLQLTPKGRSDVRATIRMDEKCRVTVTREMVDELADLLGEDNIVLRPKPPASGNRSGGRNGKGYYKRVAPQSGNAPASEAVTRFN